MLDNELIIAGELLQDGTFKPWDIQVDEALQKIKKDWDSLDRLLQPNEIVCFKITEKGLKEFEHLKNSPILKEKNPFYTPDELLPPLE